MKKNLLVIIATVVVVGIILLLITSSGTGREKKLDERITFRRTDKIPYGTYVAYQNLPGMFPKAKISTERNEPGKWDSLDISGSRQALIIIAESFYADEDEMRRLIRFVENGNDVFVSARNISYNVREMMHCSSNGSNYSYLMDDYSEYREKDTLALRLSSRIFDSTRTYIYPGYRHSSHFDNYDENTSTVMGYEDDGYPDFIMLRAGEGHFYLHLAPLAFSNYFLLHKNNFSYYEQTLSLISPETRRVVWDEYYLLDKRNSGPPAPKRGLLSVLFQYPALRAATLTALFTLLAFALLEMRRRQRIIPVVKRPANDSLDFVRTVGRLYFEKGDHTNLCRKMGSYFLEHVRSKYKLSTGNLDENFIRLLLFKTSAAEQDVRGIVSYIKYLQDNHSVNEPELIRFHQQLENFYKTA